MPQTDKLFLLPKCACNEKFEGNFCEKKKLSSCDLTKQEIDAGIQRCLNKGECIYNKQNGTQCK